MNFDFSEDQRFIQSQARQFLAEQCTPATVREVLESDAPYHAGLWRQAVELGWTGTAIPEAYGGLGLGDLELCVIAEELGRALAPIPFASSIYLAARLLQAAGSELQKERWLTAIARGDCIATLALAEGLGSFTASQVSAQVVNGRLSGEKQPVLDGGCADLAIVAAREPGHEQYSLFLVELSDAAVQRSALTSIDPSRKLARLGFGGAACERLGEPGQGTALIQAVFDQAAVLLAFEQVGGTEACLQMAKEYTSGRYAFGRPVASFQAIKHKLADMFVGLELARSNAYYGAWALSSGSEQLPLAAATARVSATDAYFFASKENIQAHGGMGFTWEFNCHLYYRRAQLLSTLVGAQPYWKNRLVDQLLADTAA